METNSFDGRDILAGLIRSSSRQQAFQWLIKKYTPGLYEFLRHLGLDHEDADEQLQEIVVKFWGSLNSLKENEKLDLALYRFAVETSFLFLQKRRGLTTDGLFIEQKMVFTLKQQEFDHHDIVFLTGIPLEEVRAHYKSAIVMMAAKHLAFR